IPRIFVDESRLVTQQANVDRPFRPTVRGFIPAIAGIDFTTAPLLLGYVASALKPGAETVLAADNRHPLLAAWRYGVGTVLAFSSDGDGPWAVGWAGWDAYGKLWAQSVRYVLRPRSSGLLSVSGRREDGALEAQVRLEEIGGNAPADMSVDLYAVDPAL